MTAHAHTAETQTTERATQGFVENLSWVRARPAVVLLEIAWRWIFGAPTLYILYTQGSKVLNAVPWQATGIADVTVNQLLTDPLRASTTIANFAAVVGPGLYHLAAWLAPILLLAWAVVSALGRTLVLRRMDASLHPRPLTAILLQLFRIVPLALFAAAWWLGVRALADWTILRPIAAGNDPAMMAYVGGVIVLSLGIFVFSAAVGWVSSIAPILSMTHNTSALRSLRDALRVGHLRNALVEINLVMGIVKIALLVLALVFSACPLPFSAEMTDEFLFWWNVAVAIWYVLASDFFHVARVSSYLHLLRQTERT